MINEENKNNGMPECIKGRYSLKATTINSLGLLAKYFNENENGNDYQILLLTPYGFIKGDIENIASHDNFITKTDIPNKYDVDLSIVYQYRNDALKDAEKDKENINLIDNGAIINLKNVTVYKDNLKEPILTTNQMIVFADQIVSFSLCPRNL